MLGYFDFIKKYNLKDSKESLKIYKKYCRKYYK